MAPGDLCNSSTAFPQLKTLSHTCHLRQQSSNFLSLGYFLLLEFSIHRKMQMGIYSPIAVLPQNAKRAEALNRSGRKPTENTHTAHQPSNTRGNENMTRAPFQDRRI